MIRVTFPRVLAAECGKLRALRSTWAMFGVVAILTVTLAGVIGWNANRLPGASNTPAEIIGRAFLGVDVFSLVLGAFGIMAITGEFGSGLIRATFAAVPRRLPVLGAKALALTALAVPVMLLVCVASLAVSQSFAPAADRLGAGDPDVLRAVLGAAAAPVALALFGLGLGAVLRHSATAITVYVLLVLVLPALLSGALPESVRDHVVKFVPVAAAQALYAVRSDGNPFTMLSPGPAAAVTLAWVLLALAAGGAVLWRRDP
ncbi:ABC transporter permease [Actinoplanes ianthinogenes]|uniref:ABC transporter permease n=1 Tax=Actinoplanes ianthinogenes TaxID=122358 RepID=A0ABM7LJR7_9ACTN|nr:ABC transporter permease subunit [Actinoplanes ianthinogenes]BCJ39492.1 ABC transporter permease [Actinoplanes ianthinogenes]GGR35708.1 ABC transporter permease [Actinoplanes ianthinogenes]